MCSVERERERVRESVVAMMKFCCVKQGESFRKRSCFIYLFFVCVL
jgi:hypothetical protein